MADHRVTDICYGHVGEGSYDLDEQNWTFTSELTLGKRSINFSRTLTDHPDRIFYSTFESFGAMRSPFHSSYS
jgi:hypothetical protein